MNLNQLKASYEGMWADCAIQPSKVAELTQVCVRLIAAKDRYLEVSTPTGVPWFVIAVIHEREASQHWWAYLGNGEPYNRITRMVPKNRGPFASWRLAAIDALTNAPPFMSRNLDWSAGGTLIHLVQYNGLGYEFRHNEWSPYIWAATNHEERGKYVGDGFYDPHVWDAQLGCAAMLKRMFELDTSIKWGGAHT